MCCHQVLLERLRNEITRLTAVKAFASIAQSPLSLDLSPVLPPLMAELTGFLRKANRVLRQASLSAIEVSQLPPELDSIARAHGASSYSELV